MGDIINSGIRGVLALLPDSPFLVVQEATSYSELRVWLSMVNWFVPIDVFVGIMEAWLACIGVYYVWQIVLRWLNVIE